MCKLNGENYIAILVHLASGEAFFDARERKYRSRIIRTGKNIQCQFLVMGRILNFSSKTLPLPPREVAELPY